MGGQAPQQRFGDLLRGLLFQRGISYDALARRANISKGYISNLVNNKKLPSPAMARLLDEILNAGGRLVDALPSSGVDTAPARGDTDDMQRREVLPMLAGLGLAGLLPGWGGDRAGTGMAIGIGTADHWRETADEYGHSYMTTPRALLIGDLAQDLDTVLRVAAHATSAAVHSGLSEAAARIACILAMCCVDLGYSQQARHAWRLARRLADESGATDVRLWVRGQEATLGPYSGRPLGFMLQIAEEGMAISPNACSAGMGHLVAARAQLLALLGRRDEALATVRQVEALYDRLPDPQKGDTGTIMTWTLPRTLHTLSYVATFSGSPDDADRAQTAALAAYPASATRSRAQVRLHQAVSAVRSGDIGGGVRHATDVLAGLPPEARGDLVFALADQAHALVPPTEQRRPEVTELREFVAEARRGHR